MADNECTLNFGGENSKQLFGRQRRRLEESVEFLIFCVCWVVMYNAWEYSTEHIKWHKYTISLFLYLYMHILVVYVKMWSFCFLLRTADVIENMWQYQNLLCILSSCLTENNCFRCNTNWLMLWRKIKCYENHTKHIHAIHRQSTDL